MEASRLAKDHENPPEQKPRGLWDVMREQRESPASEEPADSLPSSAPESDSPTANEQSDSSESHTDSSASSSKGLWAMMGVAPTPSSTNPPNPLTPPRDTENDEGNESAAPAPAWFRRKPETETESPESFDEETDWEETDEEDLWDEAEPEKPPLPVSEPSPVMVDSPPSQTASRHLHAAKKPGRSRGAMLSLAVGLIAVPLTLLAAKPEIWTRLPATATGFGALVLGLISFNEIQRSRGLRTGKGFAMAGMVLGTIAMFLGPMVVAPWSKSQNKAGRRQVTKDHLEAIGSALRQYHTRKDRYPPGGTYRVEESGETTPMHSWMTELLPYLEADTVYRDIRLDEPWSAPINKPSFSQSIPAFLVGGVEQTQNRSGYGLSHFAGVGGQVQVNGGWMANVGIFESGSEVTRQDVSDGLSQTLIAGEIPEGYRPWGEPGNWRVIGAGLNQDTTSFGNAQQTGAMFLKADGSVQFFSNGVSNEILNSLSTRDGEDNRLIPEKYR